MAEKDFLKKIGALKKEIAALREQSEVLTDRAEDIFLPGFIPPRIKESRPNSFYMTSLFLEEDPDVLEEDPDGVFIFTDYTGERGYPRAVVPLINSVGGAVGGRLEPMLLTKEIQETKRKIEVVVGERTSDLSKRIKLRPKAGAFGKVHCKEARY